ncbi:MAG: hypothetical protein Fur0035_10170 [Anaerolineales bacterium]
MSIESFKNHQYLNLETLRKNGQSVRTPVWFAQEGDALYVWTQATSGKARRVRNNAQVNIAPCKADGTPLGEFQPARASRDDSEEAIAHVRSLMAKKYGLAFQAFQLMGSFNKTAYTTLKITTAETF